MEEIKGLGLDIMIGQLRMQIEPSMDRLWPSLIASKKSHLMQLH